MTIEAQLHTEIHLINQTLAAFAIDAGTRPGWTTVAGTSYIAYGLRTGRSQPIDAIERRLPELSERISAHRGRPTPVRLRRLPPQQRLRRLFILLLQRPVHGQASPRRRPRQRA